jgi:RNA recognition motif-containing protein
MAETSRQKSTVFVGGLDNQVNAQILHDAFIPFGEIVDVSLPKPEQYENGPI